MWDTVQTNDEHLSRERPCPRCGHGMHVYLSCGDSCSCEPAQAPSQHRAA
jgi:hypothetical protein